MPLDMSNFNYGRPRCAESLPRVPPFSSMHDVMSVPASAYSRNYGRDGEQPLNCLSLAPATSSRPAGGATSNTSPGTYFGLVGRSQTSTNFVGVPNSSTIASKSLTLGAYGRTTTANHRSSMGHLLESRKQQANAFDDFFVSSRAASKSTQYIVGRQTSARPNHVCYSLQCPCQPPVVNPNMPSRTPSVPLESVPLSAYYPSPDLERFRRPVESPKLNESQNSLTNGSQDNRVNAANQAFLNYLPPPAYHHTSQAANGGGMSSVHYFDLSETSSEASTRIASRMSSDHNVTQSTENDTHHLTKAPYTITKGMVPVKKDSLYPSSGKSAPRSWLTPIRAVFCSSALIAMFTALCVVLLVVSQSVPSIQDQGLRSASDFAPILEEGSLSVVPAPTDLMDRSQVIIVNRHNPSTYQQQAQQLSELLSVVSAYNATQTDAAFPTQLVSDECSASDKFGYRSGDPCIAVVFRPNPNFIPIATKEGILELECLCENRHVRIAYSPFRGYPLRFFPRGRNASPLLAMLKFTDLPFKTELRISCGLSGATNIDPRKDRVSFQIMVI